MRTSGLRLIAGGWLLLLTDVMVRGADILPDSVGILLLFIGVRELRVFDREGITAFSLLYCVLIPAALEEAVRLSGLFWSFDGISANIAVLIMKTVFAKLLFYNGNL